MLTWCGLSLLFLKLASRYFPLRWMNQLLRAEVLLKCGYWTPALPQKLCGNSKIGRDKEPAEEFTAGRWLAAVFLKGSCFSAITRSYFNVLLCHFRLFTFAVYRGAAGDYLTANKQLDCWAGACALLIFAQSAQIPKNYL